MVPPKNELKISPKSEKISEENIMYCLVKNGKFSARFHKQAYYQLGEFIMEDETKGQFYLLKDGEKFYIDEKK